MSERQPEPDLGVAAPGVWVKPPWWLITSWLRWAYFGFVFPGVLGYSAIRRLQTDRGSALNSLVLVALGASVVFALTQLVLTLRAFRQDPTLRTRTWPAPPPGPGLSRRVTMTVATLAILAVGLVLLIYAGWAPALFVVAVLAGLAALFVRFDLFADDPPPAPGEHPDPPDRQAQTPDR